MDTAPDFTDPEKKVVNDTLQERYKEAVEIQEADTELRLDPDTPHMTVCPALYWSHDGYQFIVCKIGDSRYYAEFLDEENHHYGTGIKQYDDILDCVVSLLRGQADIALKKEGAKNV